MAEPEATERHPIPRLLESMSWLKAPLLRRGGQGWETVLVTEVLLGLDFLPRSDFLGAVLRAGTGADDSRSLLASEAESAILRLLPRSTWLVRADRVAAIEVQPDAHIETPDVLCLVEAKAIRRGRFQPEQLARSYLAVRQEAETHGKRPLLLLLIADKPPVKVKGHVPMEVRDGIEQFLPAVLARLGDDTVDVASLSRSIDSTVAWVTWPQVNRAVRGAKAKRRPGDDSGLAALDRVATAVLDAIHFHGKKPAIPRGAEPICMVCRHFDLTSMDGDLTCTAFPEIIPAPILENRVDHRNPFEGDGGLRWEQDRGAPSLNTALYNKLFGQAGAEPG